MKFNGDLSSSKHHRLLWLFLSRFLGLLFRILFFLLHFLLFAQFLHQFSFEFEFPRLARDNGFLILCLDEIVEDGHDIEGFGVHEELS